MNPNNFTDGTLIGIVVGGDVNDPASDQSCTMKVFIPGLHGKDVKPEHLAFSTMMKMPTKAAQSTFEGTLDPGSIVFVRKDTGSNQCHIIGTGNEIPDPTARVPGNIDLYSFAKHVIGQHPAQVDTKVRIGPQVQETVVNGAKVRKKQEKGQNHRHELLYGIPANGAIYPLSGAIVPSVKNVATAVQQFNNIMTPSMAAMLPGLSIPLGSILGSLASGNLTGVLANVAGNLAAGAVSGAIGGVAGQIAGQVAGTVAAATVADATKSIAPGLVRDLSKSVMGNLSPQMQMSFRNMSTLIQSIETSTGAMFSSGAKADPTTLMTNAARLLGQVKNTTDMVQVMQRLQYDTSLFGQDKLPSLTVMVDTPFGIKLPLSLNAAGIITSNIPGPLKAAIDLFTKAMSSPTGFPGVNPGENLFGGSAKTMFDMFGRLSGPSQKVAIDLSRILNQSQVARTFDQTVKNTVNGGKWPFTFG